MLSSPYPLLIVAAYLVAFAVAWHVGDSDRWREILADRLLYGVPWGTLVVVGFVVSIYLFVQGGLQQWYDPVTIPFRAWSYLYPMGIVTAAFSHHSAGHLIGNLVGTLALAPLVEFAWGHYPGGGRSDGSSTDGSSAGGSAPDVNRTSVSRDETTLSARGSTTLSMGDANDFRERLHHAVAIPWLRAFVLFPLAVLLVGLFTAVFAVGPVIGFSGVVFAFAGFAIVRYPIAAIVAVLVSSVISTTYYAIRGPVVYAEISGSAPSPPGWATVAVQGHAIGLLLGVLLALALLHRRTLRPKVGQVLLAMVIFGMTRRLWAIYWFEGNGIYVLYRGLGVSLVIFLGVLVAIAASASDRPIPETFADLPGSPSTRQVATVWLGSLAVLATLVSVLAIAFEWPTAPTFAVTWIGAIVLALPAIWALSPIELDALPTSRQTAAGVLLAALILTSVPAMLPNLVTVGDDPVPNEQAITVEGYSVTYAEDVRNGMIPAIDLPLVANRTDVATSGVIVVNEDRHIWTSELSKQYVASEGGGAVTVGGIGWRETVYVDRDGWDVVGNDTVYTVDLSHEDETVRAFVSEPSRAEPVIANHTVEVFATDESYRLRVYHDNETVGEASAPPIGNTTAAGPLTFETGHANGKLAIFATIDGTRVPIAHRESYRQN